MALPSPLHRYPYSEYVAIEEMSPVRHEFIGGDIYAMAGGTPEHAALAATILRLIGNQLPPTCRSYTSDLRVRISATDVTTYPDGAVIRGKAVRAADDPIAVTSPSLLVEITSDSTEGYDRGPKLEQYKLLESVHEVLIVSHRARRLTLHRRVGDAWHALDAQEGETIELESIDGRLGVDDAYRDGFGEG
jgi:Uma2 family endonuclease